MTSSREAGLSRATPEWASPCFVVPKKIAGEWRLVVDYRGLNAPNAARQLLRCPSLRIWLQKHTPAEDLHGD